jgi:hypothetical protein
MASGDGKVRGYCQLFGGFQAQKRAIVADSEAQFAGCRAVCLAADPLKERQLAPATPPDQLTSCAAHLIENRASRCNMRIK